jgi:excisionase family DNA binding protein
VSGAQALQSRPASVQQSLRPLDSRQQSPYLTATEAAAYLRYASVRTFYNQIGPLNIPHRRRGPRTFLFVKAELDRWLEGR